MPLVSLLLTLGQVVPGGPPALTEDYPTSALREDRQGVVGIRLVVNEGGRAEDCSVTSSSGSADLDAAACRTMLARAFKPAIDAQGKPTKASYSTRVRFQIAPDDADEANPK